MPGFTLAPLLQMPGGPTMAKFPFSLSVVIPAYNEEANIGDVVRDTLLVLRTLVDSYEVLVMDDASQDRTGAIIDRLGEEHPGLVRAFHHTTNQGTNPTLIELFGAVRYDFVFFLPADKQILPHSIAHYLEVARQGADIVLGWRARRADPFHRAFLNWLYRAIMKLVLGVSYRDASASDLYKTEVLKKISMESRGRLLQAEIATKAKCLGYRVVEVEVKHYPRQAGKQMGIAPRTAWRSLVDLWRLAPEIRKLRKLQKV